MKKEDFKVGCWYTSTAWVNTYAAKFSKALGFFNANESISKEGQHRFCHASFSGEYNTYKEVKIEEIQKYLPPTHPDLRPHYLECIKDNEYDNGANGIGKIFEVKEWLTSNTVYLKETQCSVSASRFKPSTKEAFEAQKKEKDLDPFPEKGYCLDMSQRVTDLLTLKGKTHSTDVPKGNQNAILWGKSIWWKGTISHAKSEGFTEFSFPSLTPPSVPVVDTPIQYFKEGDTVFISNRSKHYNQGIDEQGIKQPGKILEISEQYYKVQWSAKSRAYYRREDLISEKEREKETVNSFSIPFEEKSFVYINSSSDLYAQGIDPITRDKMKGVIEKLLPTSSEFRYKVRWESGTTNYYRKKDLVPSKTLFITDYLEFTEKTKNINATKAEKSTLETLKTIIPKTNTSTLLVEPVHSTKIPLSTKKKNKYFNL